MTTLGQMFYEEAMAPGRRMTFCWQRGDIADGINAVHFQVLAQAFHSAVDRVAKEANVPRDVVYVLLPDKEMGAAGDATVASQQQMAAVWSQHQGGLGGLFNIAGKVLDVHFGTLGLGIGDAISAMSNKFVQDARLKGPYEEFQRAFAAYDAWVQWAMAKIDEDASLRESYLRAQRRRRLVARGQTAALLTVVGVGSAFAWHATHESVAAQTVDAGAIPVPHASPLATLAGAWTDAGGTPFDAVVVGDEIEFRVRDAAKLAHHGLHAGDVRFALSIPQGTDGTVFAVEDHVRPAAPHGVDYATTTTVDGCVEEWNDVGGVPLRARLEEGRLSVDVAKIDAPASIFVMAGGKVVGCKALAGARSVRTALTLTRV